MTNRFIPISLYTCVLVYNSVLHLNLYHEKHCQRKKGPKGKVLSQSNCFQGAKGYLGSQIMIVPFNKYDAERLGCCLS